MDRGDDQSEQAGQNQDEGQWQYRPESSGSAPSPLPSSAPDNSGVGAASAQPKTTPDEEVEWTASEFVAHDKGIGWYMSLILAAVVVAGVVYLITKDLFSTVVVLLLAVIMAIASARKPRVLTYRLNNNGITTGTRFRSYGEYKSFAFLEEEPFASIVFIPMKRFGLPFSVYLAPEDEERVVGMVSRHLPLERGELDGVDRLMRRIRF